MNRKHFLNVGLGLATIVAALTHLPARADDIDEKQKMLEAKINEAAQANQISDKDVKVVRKEMAEYNKKKSQLRASSGDKLTLSDLSELDKSLNKVSQDFEKKKKQ